MNCVPPGGPSFCVSFCARGQRYAKPTIWVTPSPLDRASRSYGPSLALWAVAAYFFALCVLGPPRSLHNFGRAALGPTWRRASESLRSYINDFRLILQPFVFLLCGPWASSATESLEGYINDSRLILRGDPKLQISEDRPEGQGLTQHGPWVSRLPCFSLRVC